MAFRSILTVSNQVALGVGTFIDCNGSKVTLASGAVVTAMDLGRLTDLVLEMRQTGGAGGSCVTVVQDSEDGVNWDSWVVFTDAVATPVQVVPTNTTTIRPPSGLVRCSTTVTLSPTTTEPSADTPTASV